jgi:sec-independent protein translocase protein TatA
MSFFNSIFLLFNIGGGELFMIMLIVLLLFGSKRIPEVARGLGKGIRFFKDAAGGIADDFTDSIKDVKKEVDESVKKPIEENKDIL